ncbi:hypothetical protein PISL3812_08284 [Talaromyces islandicus]|uniref:Uncharacterized protein n=1 Tax=Talaromyces islandicus TaxID=28573 RepID=A0A0U1M8K1_TALIS|nr:hypothetical protein PISL3812_08284 [Talaromyces islandicus]
MSAEPGYEVPVKDLPLPIQEAVSKFRKLVEHWGSIKAATQTNRAVSAYTDILLWVMYTCKRFDKAREKSFEIREGNGDVNGHPIHNSIDDWIEGFIREGSSPLPRDMEEHINSVIPAMEDEIRLRSTYQMVDRLRWIYLQEYLGAFHQLLKAQVVEGLQVWFQVTAPSFGRFDTPENFDWPSMEMTRSSPRLTEQECREEYGPMLQRVRELWP